MSSLTFVDPVTASAGLLVARLALGLLMAAHGSQKLFGWLGGHGLTGTGGFFDSLGFRPGRVFALVAGLAEVGGGLLLALGFLGPLGPALVVSVMVVAALAVHRSGGLFAMTNGVELPLLYAAGAIALALTGPGAYSLDALLGLESLSEPTVAWTAIAAGVGGGIANLLVRRTPAAAA
jgi:putative oxidoreductase